MPTAIFAKHARAASALMKGRVKFSSVHFACLVCDILPGKDVLYMDPPYQGVSQRRGRRYFGDVTREDMLQFLRELNKLSICIPR